MSEKTDQATRGPLYAFATSLVINVKTRADFITIIRYGLKYLLEEDPGLLMELIVREGQRESPPFPDKSFMDIANEIMRELNLKLVVTDVK